MSQRHLDDLEKMLERARWRVLERFDGKSYRLPAHWIVGRPDHSEQNRVVFAGLPERDDQTISDSIGCTVPDLAGASLYFARGKSWEVELHLFVSKLNKHALSAQTEKNKQ